MSRHVIGDKQYLITGAGEANLLEVAELPQVKPGRSFLLSPHGCGCAKFIKSYLTCGKGSCEHFEWLANLLPPGMVAK